MGTPPQLDRDRVDGGLEALAALLAHLDDADFELQAPERHDGVWALVVELLGAHVRVTWRRGEGYRLYPQRGRSSAPVVDAEQAARALFRLVSARCYSQERSRLREPADQAARRGGPRSMATPEAPAAPAFAHPSLQPRSVLARRRHDPEPT